MQHVRDFVAETKAELLMIETKAWNELTTPGVLAKRKAGEEWCVHASAHVATYSGKPWRYAWVPHGVVAENRTLAGLVQSGRLLPCRGRSLLSTSDAQWEGRILRRRWWSPG